MEKIPDLHLREVIFGSADKRISAKISRLQKQGQIRKIAQRLYSSNLVDPVEEIVRRNLFTILGHLYPGAMLSHRTAFEFAPTKAGHIYLTYKYTKKISLPGITIRFLEGPGPIEGDNSFTGKLFVSQQARAFLENLQSSKRPGPASKTLSKTDIEEKLEQIARIHGEDELNKIRDKARVLGKKLDMNKEFATLKTLISAILSTHNADILSSPLAAARAFGFPYDPMKLQLFKKLFRALQAKTFVSRPVIGYALAPKQLKTDC